MQDEHSDLLTKYLEDHPDPKNRVAHLMGYPELDPKDVTTDAAARSGVERRRARTLRFRVDSPHQRAEKDPQDAEALLEMGQSDLALGLTSKSQQTLAQAAQLGSPQTRAAAGQRIAALRQMEVQRVTLTHPNLPEAAERGPSGASLPDRVCDADRSARRRSKDQIKAINSRVNSLQYEIPDFSRINIRRGSRSKQW